VVVCTNPSAEAPIVGGISSTLLRAVVAFHAARVPFEVNVEKFVVVPDRVTVPAGSTVSG
jgi:hypothetical protein